ncbi:MAG TPA: WGxxGxxG family protein [Allosphingosinicella sp.]
MTRPMLGTALAASLLWMGAAAAAQNTTEPAAGTPPPATGTAPATPAPPAPPPPPPAPAASEPTRTEVVTVPVAVPSTQSAPAPIELEEMPYPNGFADPNAAYGNDMSVAVRQENDGFDWGLLGLLGLFGLFGLYRRREHGVRHTAVHSERYDDGRPPIRPDR